MLTETESEISYRETPMPISLRLFSFVLGLGLALVTPAPFILHTDWTAPSLTWILACVCIVAPVALGCFFVTVSFASATEFRLDVERRRAVRTITGPIFNRNEIYQFSEIAPPILVMRDSDDGPYPVLRMHLPRRPVVEFVDFVGRAEAETWQTRITTVLADAPGH